MSTSNTEFEQRLLVAKAVAAKLDRAPHVIRRLDAGRREVLARAYLEHMAETLVRRSREQELVGPPRPVR